MYKRILSLVLCLALLLGTCVTAGAAAPRSAGASVTVKFDANGGAFPTDCGYIFASTVPSCDPSDTGRTVAIIESTTNKYIAGAQYDETTVNNGPAQLGYTFLGWTTALNDKNKIITKDSTVALANSGDTEVILYALWAQNYSVSLDANGGALASGDPTSLTVYAGGVYPALPTPTRAGYTFDGWYTAADNGTKVAAGDTVTNTAAHTLYAHWTGSSVTVNLDAMGGAAQTPLSVEMGKPYGPLPTPAAGTDDKHKGQTFAGWFTGPYGGLPVTDTTLVDNAAEHTLYAHWSGIQVTLDPVLPGVSLPDAVREVASGEKYGQNGALPKPTHPQQTFLGWYLSKDYKENEKVEADTLVTTTEHHTLYARWGSNAFTITFDPNGGTVSPTTKSYIYNSLSATYYTDMPTPTLANYEFDGWYDAKTGGQQITAETLVTPENRTFYAHWVPLGNVTLDPNGGALPSGAKTTINALAGGKYPLIPTPSRDGYNFAGWVTEKDNLDTKVEEGSSVGSTVPKTLYACWTSKKYTVTFDFNGASGGPVTRLYAFGAKYGSLPSCHRGGYSFVGWFTEKEDGEEVTIDTVVSIPKDHTLYARWGFTVDYNANGGTGSMPQSKALAGKPFTLPACSFTPPMGMAFSHWSIGSEMGPEITGSTHTFTANTTLYAHWKDTPITITASATTGGSISPAGTISVDKGKDQAFQITIKPGYELVRLEVDGEDFGPLESYVFRRVEENHTIHAVFLPEALPGYLACGKDLHCPLDQFTDLNPTSWYHNAVHYCLDNVLITGVDDRNHIYSLNSKTDRASLATILWRAEGCPNPAPPGALERPYKDVTATKWFYKGVTWATKAGIVNGYGNGYFGPSDKVTREQVAAILWRHAGTPKPISDHLAYTDSWKVSEYFWDAMCWATEQGILKGKGGGVLDPKGYATRVEIAQMMLNYLGEK